ncbi:MAG: flagellar protein export ATPase FliI [Gammaproteobacteria bacterium]|nr:flagellar protein export ATPase FliI [Gammaproteobacteria bacterium]MDH4313262.1 flagellar protein export ATPase FliI [Gammaproteobacteria bacterium]MDH5212937.1 flagellar protein export ATPase FliI [Gammaproteobacteria bacterium]MDH5500210.1 flagellar protein export ATPase FliI [Gammaproteobacteria bacterium]
MDRAYDDPPVPVVEGILRRSVGLAMEAEGVHSAVGGRCDVIAEDGRRIETEVVGFAGERLYLMPAGDMRGIVPNARVIPVAGVPDVLVGDDLLGRILDGRGKPLDKGQALEGRQRVPLFGQPINPLQRLPIRKTLDVGIRSINALLSIGRGQRMGLFAGSGVGKSMLLGMMTRNTDADVVVVGLVGERGREVREFIETSLGEEGMKKAVVIATPADDTPLMRMHGAWLSAAIAEYFRDRGMHVLLLMDSLTRFAQAQREIALAIGEPPATKGYPPSVFAKLPQLVERAGNGSSDKGSVTAFYTVLAEGDDPNDPIVDAARAILDGHITLSRQLADAGIYPAIDIESSVSRAMSQITTREHQELISRFRHLYSVYQEHRDLISVGAYRRGSDPRVDDAISRWPAVLEFLRQQQDERVDSATSLQQLRKLLNTSLEKTDEKAKGEAAS